MATTGLFVITLAASFIAPALIRSRPGERVALQSGLDTVTLLGRAAEARQRLAQAESQVGVANTGTGASFGASEQLTSSQRQSRDSLRFLARSLDELLDRATKAPLPASFRALAAATALRGDVRTKTLNDSLDALDRRRAALGPTTGAERASAEITDQVNEVGARIREAAIRRRSGLARALAPFEMTTAAVPTSDGVAKLAALDSARQAVQRAESLVVAARTRDAEVLARENMSVATSSRRVPPVALLVAAFIIILLVRFGWSLASEVKRPTIGGAHEAERAAGAPVITIVRPPAVNRSVGGIDPFRMLYLALTATGTKMRTVVIAGDERGVVATVAARLASAAAGDARATLVVDSDPEGSSLGGFYRLPPEPGFTDAVAGVHLWSDVTHSIGASEGLSIDVVTGGTIRRDEPDERTLDAARTEFAHLRGEYDLCVVVAPTAVALQRVTALVGTPVTVLCAEIGSTSIEWMLTESARAKFAGAVLHGLVLWQGPVPHVQTRAKQVASAYRKVTG